MEFLFGPIKSLRSRAIWDPAILIKLFGGLLNHNLIKLTKLAMNEFISGLNLDELGEAIKEMKQHGDGFFVSADGSSHDSSQKSWWIEAVDNYIIGAVGPIILRRLGFDEMEVE